MTGKSHSHIGKYIGVFVTLLVLTAITVAISKFHISVFLIAVALAMVVAITKGSLVMAYFMHLIGENKVVYMTLIITVIFFALMMLVPVLSNMESYNVVMP